MKYSAVAAGLILPLVVGLLHHDVRIALETGKWATAAGQIIGFNGLFALGGVVLAAVFTAKNKLRSAWICTVTATIISGGFSASSRIIEARNTEKIFSDHLKQINGWNQRQAGKAVLTLQSGQSLKVEKARLSSLGYFQAGMGFRIAGSLSNNTDEKIVAAVIDWKITKKNTNQVVVSHRFAFPLTVFPSAILPIDNVFVGYDTRDDSLVMDYVNAIAQLGDEYGKEYGQQYDVVAFVPESLDTPLVGYVLKTDVTLKMMP